MYVCMIQITSSVIHATSVISTRENALYNETEAIVMTSTLKLDSFRIEYSPLTSQDSIPLTILNQ